MYYGKAIRPTCQPFRAYFYNWIAFLVENQHVPAIEKKADFFSQPPMRILFPNENAPRCTANDSFWLTQTPVWERRKQMAQANAGNRISESRRVVRGGRAHGVNLHPVSFSAWAALSPIKRRQSDFFLCRKTSGTADSVRLIKRWDGLFSSNCKEEHPE